MLFICFQRLRKFDHFSRSPRRNTRNYLSPVESRGRSTTLRHFHLSSQGRSVHFRCSNSMEFGGSSSSFSFSLKVKNCSQKSLNVPFPVFSCFPGAKRGLRQSARCPLLCPTDCDLHLIVGSMCRTGAQSSGLGIITRRGQRPLS